MFGSKCPEEGGGVPLRNSTSDQDERVLVALFLCLQLHVCTPSGPRMIQGVPSLLPFGCQLCLGQQ